MKRRILLLLVIIIVGLAVFFLFNRKPERPIISKPLKVKADDSLVFKQLEKIKTYKIADSLYFADAFDSAIHYFDKTLFGLPLSNNLKIKQQVLNRIGYTYILKADYKKASVYLKEALRLTDSKDSCITNAITYDYVGTLKSYTQELDSALVYFRKAEPMYKKTIGENNLMFIKFLVRLANTFKNSGEISNTEKYYLKALQLLEKYNPEKNSELYVNVLSNVESCLILKHDYNKALSYGFRALQIALKSKESERFLESCYGVIGNVYIYLGNYIKAIEFYNKALEVNSRSPYINEASRKVRLSAMAEVFYILKDYPKAIFYCNEANSISTDISKSYDVVAHIYLIQGLTYQELMDSQKAITYLKKNLAIRKQYFGEKSLNTSESYYWLGKYFASTHGLDSALNYYQKALISASSSFNSQDISKNPCINDCIRPSKLIQYIEAKAKALEDKYKTHHQSLNNLAYAISCYKLMDSLIVFSRRTMDTEDSKLYFSSSTSQLYEKAIDCAYKLYTITKEKEYADQAFKFMEKNKYLLLLENLSTAEATNVAGVPDSLVAAERDCNIELNYIKDKLNKEYKRGNKDTLRIRQLNNKEFDLIRQLERVHNTMNQKYPKYFNIKYEHTNYTLTDLQIYSTTKNARIVEYFWGTNAIYCINVNGHSVTFTKAFNDIEFQSQINKCITFCESVHLSSRKSFGEYAVNALNLCEILLKQNDAKDLPRESKPANLIVIPDGLLSKVSFEAMVTSSPKTNMMGYKNLDYLIFHYNIQYAYSSNILLSKRNTTNTRIANRLVGFSYSGDKTSINNRTLPGTYNELKGISEYYSSRLFLGKEATVDNFKRNAPNKDIIHLALHGIADSENDTITSLIFQAGKDKQQEKHLYRNEIYSLNLNAQMVVLSACETGLGKNYKGEGVFSMARAFSYAGCPTVVLSLWDVTDQSTARLMTNFYKQLSKGQEVDKALREAKLDYLKKCDEIGFQPAFWASFVAYGEMSPIRSAKHDILWIILLIIVAVGLVILYIWFNKKSRANKNSHVIRI